MNEGNSIRSKTRAKDMFVRLFLSLMLITSLCLPAKKAEAFVPVAVGGVAAGAAVATEIGISTEALAAATLAVIGVGTGVAVTQGITERGWKNLWLPGGTGSDPADYYPEYGNGQMNLPGVKPWDDLTDQEKANWDSPKQYVQSQWVNVWLELGLISEDGNGGYEPTPEPEDPNDKKKWQKGRNIMAMLGVMGGSVAANEVTAWLAEQIGTGIKNMLFGDGQGGMDLTYTADFTVGGEYYVPFMYKSVTINRDGTLCNGQNALGYERRSDGRLGGIWLWNNSTGSSSGVGTPNLTGRYNNAGGTTGWTIQITGDNGAAFYLDTKQAYLGGSPSLLFAKTNVTKAWQYYLNPVYPGLITFPGGETYLQGTWTGNVQSGRIDYNQYADTPQSLQDAVIQDNQAVADFGNSYTDAGNDETRVVSIPSQLTNADQESTSPVTINYNDYITVVPDENVEPVPDDRPYQPSNPENPDNPDNPDTPETDFTQEVQRLLQQPFNQLFPFCLIGDLQRLLDIIKDAAYQPDSGLRAQSEEQANGTSALVLPLSDFGVDGIEDFTIDLTPVSDLAVYVRPMLSALFITGLLVGTFRFFINRGGE